MADKFTTRLYNADGSQFGELETDEDLSLAEHRDKVVESGGKTYIWNQRNGRWQQASDTVKLGRAKQVGGEQEDEVPASGPTTSKG